MLGHKEETKNNWRSDLVAISLLLVGIFVLSIQFNLHARLLGFLHSQKLMGVHDLLCISAFTTVLCFIWYSWRRLKETKQLVRVATKSEESIKNLCNSLNDAVFVLDRQGRIVFVNTTAYERLGYTEEEMLSMHITQLDTSEFAARVSERIQNVEKRGKAVFESAHVRRDGSVMPIEVNAIMANIDGNQYLLNVVRDVSRRKEAVRESERRIQELEDYYAMSVDRELKMVELKKKIKELQSEICKLRDCSSEEYQLFHNADLHTSHKN